MGDSCRFDASGLWLDSLLLFNMGEDPCNGERRTRSKRGKILRFTFLVI